MSTTIVGKIPNSHPAEMMQFKRVLNILRKKASLIGDWSFIVLDQKYSHEAGALMDSDTDWNGQIDMLLISANKIVVYELKGFVTKIEFGTTNE